MCRDVGNAPERADRHAADGAAEVGQCVRCGADRSDPSAVTVHVDQRVGLQAAKICDQDAKVWSSLGASTGTPVASTRLLSMSRRGLEQ